MAEIQPIVSDVTIGNATAAIDCEWLKCIESVNFSMKMEEVPIVCDWANGQVTALRGNPMGECTINALNWNSTVLKYALDADVSTKAGAETVSCEEHQITWVPDDENTPTEWTATVTLNSPEVASVTVWTDSSCTSTWESVATPDSTISITSACKGLVTLTTDDVDETDTTLYFAYTHDTETPTDATLIEPGMSTFADDHKLHILHRNATTGDLIVVKFWRVQIIPDFTVGFDNTNSIVTVPIRLRILSDRSNHPDAPLGHIAIIDADDSEAADFTYDFYTKVRAHID